jgi:serine/threonine protein kinase
MARRYRCPHCAAIQMANPDPSGPTSVTCDSCGGRFRIPKAKGPVRRKTSMAQQAVKKQITAQADAMRSDGDKARLEKIVRERRLGDYDILNELGRGGMGVVYKAYHRPLKRIVALKLILPDTDDPETLLKRFEREAELHARLQHPNIVHVLDSGVVDHIHYFAMDFVVGTQLTKLIGSPEFTMARRVEMTRQIASALAHAHSNGVVHRDIKPDNIVIDAGWKAHLVDFGIAKPTDTTGMENLTRQGLAVGTPHYMAPEQFRPKLGEVGPRADIYSLGAVLFHTMAGHPPYEASTAHEVLIKAATQPTPKIEGTTTPSDETVTPDLAAILRRCLVKKPEDRYQTSHGLAEELSRFLAGKEVQARPLSGAEKLMRIVRKNRAAVGMSVMALMVLMIIIATLIVSMLFLRGQNDDIGNDLKSARSAVESLDESDHTDAVGKALGAAEAHLESGGLQVLITTVLASILAVLLVFAATWFLVIGPVIRASAPRNELAPTEISTTADEVG